MRASHRKPGRPEGIARAERTDEGNIETHYRRAGGRDARRLVISARNRFGGRAGRERCGNRSNEESLNKNTLLLRV